MIPASLCLDTIRAERQHDLERWQLARMAHASHRAEPHADRLARVGVVIDPRRWLERPARMTASSDEHVALSAACC